MPRKSPKIEYQQVSSQPTRAAAAPPPFALPKAVGAEWAVVGGDDHWDVHFEWRRVGLAYSLAACRWHLPPGSEHCGGTSASPTACPSRGYGCAGTQNDRLSKAVILSTSTPIPARWTCIGDAEMPIIVMAREFEWQRVGLAYSLAACRWHLPPGSEHCGGEFRLLHNYIEAITI